MLLVESVGAADYEYNDVDGSDKGQYEKIAITVNRCIKMTKAGSYQNKSQQTIYEIDI